LEYNTSIIGPAVQHETNSVLILGWLNPTNPIVRPVTVYLLLTMGAFFWDYSGIGILGIDGICVLLGAIPFILLPIAE